MKPYWNYREAASEAQRIRREVRRLRRVGIDLRDTYLPIARECETEARYWRVRLNSEVTSPNGLGSRAAKGSTVPENL